MAEGGFGIGNVRLRKVERDLRPFMDAIHSGSSCIVAVSFPELCHYFASEGSAFYEVQEGKNIIGTVFVIFRGKNRNVVTAIAMENSKGNTKYYLQYDDVRKLGGLFCINFSSNINLPDLCIGDPYWEIREYSMSPSSFNIVRRRLTLLPDYTVESRDVGNIDDIIAFDKELFSLEDRQEFIKICAYRSDGIYVVRMHNEIQGFGMISTPMDDTGKRLLGPIYVKNDAAVPHIVENVFSAVLDKYETKLIVAYVPLTEINATPLYNLGFGCSSGKIWTRYSKRNCGNYGVNVRNIIALGSLVFDVC